MNIHHLKKAKSELELEIQQVLNPMLNSFETKTGVLVNSISINFYAYNEVGTPNNRYFIEGVRVHIDL